ncbi:hypothetical protein C1H46_039786 [Malus baccata]|uniref:Bulb-type lectin domain-containing protein n=1 Tax=Malus baccata TaxID=106549 RepID=A0A540KKC5_MALBA|nr:hypothetical protein C1H46_039786 [Malus baccata]
MHVPRAICFFLLSCTNPSYLVLLKQALPAIPAIVTWDTKLPISHPDAVWVANSKTPLSDLSGVFTSDSDGKLKIVYSGGQIPVLDTNQTASGNVTATFLGTGNLVLQEIASSGALGSVLWGCFDHLTNTFLPLHIGTCI